MVYIICEYIYVGDFKNNYLEYMEIYKVSKQIDMCFLKVV